MGGGGKSKSVTTGYWYYLGMHMVICQSPVDSIERTMCGDRNVIGYPINHENQFTVYAQNLFGGRKREGGVQGPVQFRFGGATQDRDDYLVEHLGNDIPAYRGVVSFLLKKCKVCANNPYPKPWSFLVKRIPDKAWQPAYADINSGSANPAHMIRECIYNKKFGMGKPLSSVDNTSFMYAAEKLYDEDFGLSMVLGKQGQVMNFIGEIEKYIGGTCFISRSTGQYTLKLFRDDYDVGTIPSYDESTIKSLDSFQRPLPSEMKNELILKYRKRGEAKDSAITVQDLASIQAQGGIISQTINFRGIDSDDLATRVAARELQQNSTPLALAQMTANRNAWNLEPGDVFKFSWSALGIVDMVMRVTKVDYGTLNNSEIVINCTEDIFGLPTVSYITPQSSIWVDPAGDPTNVPGAGLWEIPYYDLAMNMSRADFDQIEPEDTFIHSAARSTAVYTSGYDLYIMPDGATDYDYRGDGDYTATVLLSQDLNKTQKAGITISTGIEDDVVEIGTYAVIGNDLSDKDNYEIVRIDDIDTGAGTVDLGRGCLDTVAHEHANGTRIWFVPDFGVTDETFYNEGELISAKFVTIGASSQLDIATATVHQLTTSGRQRRPYVPGNPLFNGVLYDDRITGLLTASWAHRDRTQQTGETIVDQEIGDIGPEAGVTYTVQFFGAKNLNGTTPDKEYTGLTGTSQEWTTEATDAPFYHYAPATNGDVRVPLKSNERIEGTLSPYDMAQNVTNVVFTPSPDRAELTAGYMDIGLFNPGDDFTVLFHANFATEPTGANTILSQCTAAGLSNFEINVSDDDFTFKVNGQSGYENDCLTIGAESVYMVTVEKNQPAAGQTRITTYKDGVLVGSVTITDIMATPAGKDWCIGGSWSNTTTRDQLLTGTLGDVRIFSGVLTTTDVWPVSSLNPEVRTVIKSVDASAYESHQKIDHTVERELYYGYNFGNLYGGE